MVIPCLLYTSETGKDTRWGMLYRSAQIDSIPFCSRRELKNMGIRTIIDLRSEEERHNYPQFHDEDFNVLHLPIATGNMEHILQDIRDKKIETDTIYRLVAVSYTHLDVYKRQGYNIDQRIFRTKSSKSSLEPRALFFTFAR